MPPLYITSVAHRERPTIRPCQRVPWMPSSLRQGMMQYWMLDDGCASSSLNLLGGASMSITGFAATRWQATGYKPTAGATEYWSGLANGTALVEFAVSYWIYFDSTPGTVSLWSWSSVVGSTIAAVNLFARTRISAGGVYVLSADGLTAAITTTVAPTVQRWEHHCVTLGGNVWTFYVNGKSAGTYTDDSTHAQQASATSMFLGAGGTASAFAGRMVNLAVWHRCLAAPEVFRLFLRPVATVRRLWSAKHAAQSLTLTLTENATIAEARKIDLTRTLAEAATLGETRKVDLNRLLADVLVLTEARKVALTRTITDTATLGEARSIGGAHTLSDPIILSEALNIAPGLSFSEALSISESRNFAVGRSLADGATLGEARSIDGAHQLGDVVTPADATPGFEHGTRLGDTLTVSEIRRIALQRALNEAVNTIDLRTIALGYELTEQLTLTEALARAITRELTEQLAVTDVRTIALTTALAEALLVADTRAFAISQVLVDSCTLGETISTVIGIVIARLLAASRITTIELEASSVTTVELPASRKN